MKINIKLYAMLADYLPSGADKNIAEIEVESSTTPNQLINKYKIPPELAHLVLLNGVYVEPEERDTQVFKDGDTLAIWPPVAGG